MPDTTLAIGEEDFDTTMALGEEEPYPTTLALGEEDDDFPVYYSTDAFGA